MPTAKDFQFQVIHQGLFKDWTLARTMTNFEIGP